MKKKKCHLGIDLGGTNLKGGLVDTKGRIFAKYTCPIDANKGGKAVLKKLIGFIHEISHDAVLQGIQIKGIGIGTPGAVDFQKGCVGYGASNLPGWKGIPFIKIIQKDFRIRAFAHNDATLAALAEARFGMGKGKKNIICVTLGTGIGGGVIIDGKVYHGRSAYAGEIGHMKIVPDGRVCTCGANGCWEAYVSATGVVNMAKEYSQKKKSSQLYKKYHNRYRGLGAKEVYVAAQQGDAIAKKVVKEVGYYLGLGLANLVNIFNPEMVILSGGMSQETCLMASMKKSFRVKLFRRNNMSLS